MDKINSWTLEISVLYENLNSRYDEICVLIVEYLIEIEDYSSQPLNGVF